MKQQSWSWFLVGLLFEVAAAGGNGEVAALLDFKQKSVHSDPNGVLAGWTAGSSTPCLWRGVTCGSDGLVVSLDLRYSGLSGQLHLPSLAGGGPPGLRHINLGGNFFSAGDLSAAAGPCLLETLDLSANNLSDPLPQQSFLASCDRLWYLNLSRNSIPGGRILVGPSLLQLDLSRNRVSDRSTLVDALSGCRNLNLLNFSDNKLAGELRATLSLSSCRGLVTLDLSCNNLSGAIPPRFAADPPPSMVVLDLSQNIFSGDISGVSFGNCGNLTSINLSHNSLSGDRFPASLASCGLLESLDLSENRFEGEIAGDLLGGLRSLKKLSLAGNRFSGSIPAALAMACETLRELDLSDNRLSGGLPGDFAACSVLESLNLGGNTLSGDFLTTVVSGLTELRYLLVPFNNITGPVPLSLTNCSKLEVLDLSSNGFVGSVPAGFCSSTAFSALRRILLANNDLSGPVPVVLGNCKSLKGIDLSFNRFTGPIPAEIWSLPQLYDLVMWANDISGGIPEGICENGGGNLEALILNNNLLTGGLPKSITSCTNMMWLSLSANRLTGEIPSGIGNLAQLAVLQMGNNSLSGPIPPELGNCKSLVWLDLNSNNLSGPLPPELASQTGLITPGKVSGKKFAFVRNEGGTACRGAGGLVEFQGITPERLEKLPMVHSCPTTRIYSGLAVYTFTSNGSMIYLDLSYNSLSGTIPDEYGSMSYLHVLNLGHNTLFGNIPNSLGDLKAVGVLDLSHNLLQGNLPGSLGGLSFLSDFDVSNNNLSGSIPSDGQLTTFPASRYDNNSGLCNLPLPPCGSASQPSSSNHLGGKGLSVKARTMIGISFFLVCVIGLTLALFRVKKYQQKEEKRERYIDSLPTSGTSSWKLSGVPEPLSINVATFEKPLRKLTFAHLLEATNGFSAGSLIGSGGFGQVYKAQLRDGSVVAIKKLIHVTDQGDREFMAEMETIGKIKHRNLVPLLGYCKVGEERLLVYEYMRWGSLEAVLHDGTKGKGRLDWAARKKVAVGSARGLAFLHHSCIPHIIHRDMKSSNVLLDENFEARVSDFGMARLVNALDTHLSVSTLAGTPGYVPPEYYQSFRCTAKGDVYSYGVVLLELISGKKPIDTAEFGEDTNLVGWAKQLQKEKRSNEILDHELMELEGGELFQYLKIAFLCLEDRPFRRPTMIQVMSMFRELQGDSENDILDGLSPKDVFIEELLERQS